MMNVNGLTLGEIDKIEELSGQSVAMLGDDETPKGRMMAALAFVMKRRQQLADGEPPSFTWNDALGLTMEDANEILGITAGDVQAALEAPGDAPKPNRAARRAQPKKKAHKGSEPDPTGGE